MIAQSGEYKEVIGKPVEKHEDMLHGFGGTRITILIFNQFDDASFSSPANRAGHMGQ
jgi:hypothetical protein